jgi:hypothetical protein
LISYLLRIVPALVLKFNFKIGVQMKYYFIFTAALKSALTPNFSKNAL